MYSYILANPNFPRFLGALWQGELVDRIEYCVTQTGDHIGRASGELKKAGNYQRKARKVKRLYQEGNE